MRDTPTQRGLPPELDRASHERRARLIAQLHRQAIATANDLAVRQKAIKADIAKDARRGSPGMDAEYRKLDSRRTGGGDVRGFTAAWSGLIYRICSSRRSARALCKSRSCSATLGTDLVLMHQAYGIHLLHHCQKGAAKGRFYLAT